MRLVILVLALAALATPARSAAASDSVIAELPQAVPIASLGSTLAFSRPAGAQWRLVLWQNGVARDAPVAPAAQPFDVDLGHGPTHRLMATYSRGGVIRTLDVASGRERSTRRAGERPSLWWPLVVYAHDGQLWRADLARHTAKRLAGTLPDGWDLRGARVIATRTTLRDERRVVHLSLLGGPDLLRHSSGALSRAEMTRPEWIGPHTVFVAKVRRAEAGQRFVRVNTRTKARREVLSRSNVVAAAALGRRVAYINTRSENSNACEDIQGNPVACPLAVTPPLDY